MPYSSSFLQIDSRTCWGFIFIDIDIYSSEQWKTDEAGSLDGKRSDGVVIIKTWAGRNGVECGVIVVLG